MKLIPVLSFALFALCCFTMGCGGGSGSNSTSCSPTGLSVFPQAATVNHNSGSNAQQFGTTEILPTGCTTPTTTTTGITWSSSDPNDAPVNTTGLVTCLHATTGSATIIATLPGVTQPGVSGTTSLTGSASITCN
jgi:uncharacterized protein YjdB